MTPITESTAAATAPEMLPPDAQLLQLACGAFVSQAVYVVAKLGIADLVADGPRDVAYLADKTVTDERSLYRLLRACAHAEERHRQREQHQREQAGEGQPELDENLEVSHGRPAYLICFCPSGERK